MTEVAFMENEDMFGTATIAWAAFICVKSEPSREAEFETFECDTVDCTSWSYSRKRGRFVVKPIRSWLLLVACLLGLL